MMLRVRVMDTEKCSEVMPRATSCLRLGTLSSPISSRLLRQDRPRKLTEKKTVQQFITTTSVNTQQPRQDDKST